MHVILTCEYEKDQMKNSRESGKTVLTILTLWELSVAMETRVLVRPGPKPNATEIRWQHQFFRHSRAGNSVVCGWIWLNF